MFKILKLYAFDVDFPENFQASYGCSLFSAPEKTRCNPLQKPLKTLGSLEWPRGTKFLFCTTDIGYPQQQRTLCGLCLSFANLESEQCLLTDCCCWYRMIELWVTPGSPKVSCLLAVVLLKKRLRQSFYSQGGNLCGSVVKVNKFLNNCWSEIVWY